MLHFLYHSVSDYFFEIKAWKLVLNKIHNGLSVLCNQSKLNEKIFKEIDEDFS